MTLSIDGQPGDVSRRVTYLSARSEGQVADLKRRIPILKRLITDCDHLAADLEQEIRNEEDRVNSTIPCISPIRSMPGRRLRGAII